MDVFSKISCGIDGSGVGSGAGSTASVHEDTDEGLRESEVGEIDSEGVNVGSNSQSGTLSAHEEDIGGVVRVIKVVSSDSDSGMMLLAGHEDSGDVNGSVGDVGCRDTCSGSDSGWSSISEGADMF
jgi:hypothetical protein